MRLSARFCQRCGDGLSGPPPTRCPACGYEIYVNARPTASVIVVDGDRFLGLLRTREPRAGWWELPGGFCDTWEHPAHAAVREAREELGVPVVLGDFVGMYIGGYEFQGENLSVLDSCWLARIGSEILTLDPRESRQYAWLPLVSPPPLAFQTSDAAVRDAAIRLRAAGLIGCGPGH
jgi:8-oxo-dGTP diphosphatase